MNSLISCSIVDQGLQNLAERRGSKWEEEQREDGTQLFEALLAQLS